MDNDLKKSIDSYVEAFLEQKIVQQYFLLEKEINNSQEIANLRENLKQVQKNLALSISDEEEHQKCLTIYNNALEEFNNNPLIANYNLLKEEIYLKLKQLEERIKE